MADDRNKDEDAAWVPEVDIDETVYVGIEEGQRGDVILGTGMPIRESDDD